MSLLRQLRCSRHLKVFVLVACCAAVTAGAQSPLDMSGSYIENSSGKHVSGNKTTILISQTDNQIEIRRQWNGTVQISTFPLDGSPGVYRTASGVQGQGSAHWKGSTLSIETLVAAPSQGGKTIRFHTKEQWQLSKDKQTLKIHVETDSPDMPVEITNAAIAPYTDVYQRSPSTP